MGDEKKRDEVLEGMSLAVPIELELVSASEDRPYLWFAVLLRAGVDKNGTNWLPGALMKAAPMFAERPIKVYDLGGASGSYFDHLPQKIQNEVRGGLLKATAGVITKSWWDADRNAVVGNIHVFNGWLQRILAQLRGALKGKPIRTFGLSINGLAKGVKTAAGMTVQAISEVTSVDLVTRPAAGGEFVRALASLASAQEERNTVGDKDKTVTVDNAEEINRRVTAAEEAAAAAARRAEELEQRLQTRMRDSRVRAAVEDLGRDLTAAVRGTAIRALVASVPVDADEDAVLEAVKTELEPHIEAAKASRQHNVETVTEPVDKLRSGILQMLDVAETDEERVAPAFHSLRASYQEFTGDTGMTQDIAVRAAAGPILPTTWGTILGEALHRRVRKEYNAIDYGEQRLVSTNQPVSDFKAHHISAVGGFGDLARVVVNGTYPEFAALPPEESATLSVSKRGVILKVAWETVVNDDLGAVNRATRKLGRAARRTFAKAVYSLLSDNGTIYDAMPLFDATHGNLGAAALDYASLIAGRLAMLAQTEPGSGDKLGIDVRHGGLLVIPSELYTTVYELLQAKGKPGGTTNDGNAVSGWFGQNLENVIENPFTADANDWFLVGNPAQFEGIVAGWLNGQQQPDIRTQQDPTAFAQWNNDVIEYKVRHVWGLTVADYRPFYGAIVV